MSRLDKILVSLAAVVVLVLIIGHGSIGY